MMGGLQIGIKLVLEDEVSGTQKAEVYETG